MSIQTNVIGTFHMRKKDKQFSKHSIIGFFVCCCCWNINNDSNDDNIYFDHNVISCKRQTLFVL